MTKTTTSQYIIKCDECHEEIGTTDNPARSAEGGHCAGCAAANTAANVRFCHKPADRNATPAEYTDEEWRRDFRPETR